MTKLSTKARNLLLGLFLVVVAGSVARPLVKHVAGNTDLIMAVITVISIFIGFTLTILTILVERHERSVAIQDNTDTLMELKQKKKNRKNAERNNLVKMFDFYYVLVSIYLLTLVFALLALLSVNFLTRGVFLSFGVNWLFVPFAIIAIALSFLLPKRIIGAEIERYDQS